MIRYTIVVSDPSDEDQTRRVRGRLEYGLWLAARAEAYKRDVPVEFRDEATGSIARADSASELLPPRGRR